MEIKNGLFLFLGLFNILLFTQITTAQQNFEVLRADLTYIEKGELNLLILETDKKLRFFVEKENELIELEEKTYIDQINRLTSDRDLNTLKLRYNLKSISRVIKDYNREKSTKKSPNQVGARLGFWGGQNNFIHFSSIGEGNENILFLGAELEAFGKDQFKRHSAVFQFRKSFPGEVVDLDLNEFMIGYRFNLINHKKFMFYLEAELINFSYYDLKYTSSSNDSQELIEESKRLELDTPLGFGAGIAIQIFRESYFTSGYSNIVQLNTVRDDFPVDIRMRLKFNL